jgi:hypothetical protein
MRIVVLPDEHQRCVNTGIEHLQYIMCLVLFALEMRMVQYHTIEVDYTVVVGIVNEGIASELAIEQLHSII